MEKIKPKCGIHCFTYFVCKKLMYYSAHEHIIALLPKETWIYTGGTLQLNVAKIQRKNQIQRNHIIGIQFAFRFPSVATLCLFSRVHHLLGEHMPLLKRYNTL